MRFYLVYPSNSLPSETSNRKNGGKPHCSGFCPVHPEVLAFAAGIAEINEPWKYVIPKAPVNILIKVQLRSVP